MQLVFVAGLGGSPVRRYLSDPSIFVSTRFSLNFQSFRRSLQAPGLVPLLETDDYGCWDAAVAHSLGHHRSRLLSHSSSFKARFRLGQIEELQLIHLRGSGRLELVREQCDHAVLWMPIQGMTEEIVNGTAWLAEPGSALLFLPGDHMHGHTSDELEGISVLIPMRALPGLDGSASPLIQAGPIHQHVLGAARELAMAAAQRPGGARWAADHLLHSLAQWAISVSDAAPRERITAVRRRALVGQAREWMEARLTERFSVIELSRALEVSVRNLQYSFQTELGCTPMAEAKRLRLRRLRQLLQAPELASSSIAELMEASGLLACGVTAADYRQWCGESPRHTRMRSRA